MTIKEVAEKFDLSEATLRYYEQEGLIINVPRKNGIRHYTDENIRVIEFLIFMRSSGMSIDRLKKYMELYEKPNTEKARLQILEDQYKEVEDKIEMLKASLDKLSVKIDYIKNEELK